MRVTIALAATVLLTLTGCTGSGDEPTAPASIEQAAEEPAPDPEPTFATEQQVASAIARHHAEWQEIIEEATYCRLVTIVGDSPLQAAESRACIAAERAMTDSAREAARGLRALAVPPSMLELVDETVPLLNAVANANIGEHCETIGTDACDDALGAGMLAYTDLEATLNAWSPYL